MEIVESNKILRKIEADDEIKVETKIYYRTKKQDRSYFLTYYMKAKEYKRNEIIKRMKTLAFFKGSIEDKKILIELKKEL